MLAHISTDGDKIGEQFAPTVEYIVRTSNWYHEGDESAVARARRAVRLGDPVVRLTMPGIDAQLELEYRDRSDVICDIALFSTLDPQMEPHDTGFTEEIAASHHHIGTKYSTGLLKPCSNIQVVLTGSIPSSVSKLTIQTTVTGLSAAALEAEWLHSQIKAPLDTFLSAVDGPDNY